MTHIDKLIPSYVGERLQRGEIEKITARNITTHLRTFSTSHGNRTLQQLGPKAVDRWLEDTAHLASSTRASRLSTLRGFARWLVLNNHIERDFTLATPRIRRVKKPAPTLTEDDARATLAACGTERERLLVWLMFGAGLRCVECSRLDVEDYDANAKTLHVTGKAMHQRIVPLGEPVWRMIEWYLWRHPTPCGPLVQREDGASGRLSPERISGIVGKLVRKAGVKQRNFDGRAAHGFRACAASDLLDHNAAPQVVADFLGHSGLANLAPYTRRSELGRVRDAVDLRWSAA